MESDFQDFIPARDLHSDFRPLRLRLDTTTQLSSDMLLPQRVYGAESLCSGLEYRILCVSVRARLPLKEFIGLPAALDFVTDTGNLRSVCGIITEITAGDCDGGLASYQLVLRDALSLMEKRINTRVFRDMNEVEIVQAILSEWRVGNRVLSMSFKHEVGEFFETYTYPKREFTMQHNESDAAFVRRLLRRRGISWFFRAEHGKQTLFHTMVMINRVEFLHENAAGTVRYHRDSPTEERDSITSWNAVHTLQPGSTGTHSWDYRNPLGVHAMSALAEGEADHGSTGRWLAATMDDYQVLPPHAGDDCEDLYKLGQLRMKRHDFESHCFHAEGTVRDLCVGEYFKLEGHPETDSQPDAERDFVVTALQITAQNNLPKALAARVEGLFARNRWMRGQHDAQLHAQLAGHVADGPSRLHIQFTAVRRGVPIVPGYDPRTDLPQPQMQSAIVVGPDNEEVYCDEMGRVKIRFPGTRPQDHQGRGGACDNPHDSAWVRVASNWAGNGPGYRIQCGTMGLPRIGTEVLIAFLGGDPDKPVIVGQMYNGHGKPPALNSGDRLPGNRYLSGIKSRENKGGRANQLRLDDTEGQISAQLASDHGNSQLNLGFLTKPKTGSYGEPRGEGAELRTDQKLAIRGAEGVLITAANNGGVEGKLMEREELTRIAEGLQKLSEELAKLAEQHAADEASGPALSELVEKLKKLHEDSAPLVAVSAPAGLVLGSPQNVALGAATDIDLISAEATHLSAGSVATMRAVKGVSVFANQGGIKLTAAAGKVNVQAQDDQMQLLAQKVLEIISNTDWISLKAKQGIRINGGGTELELSAAGIKGYTAGNHHMYAAEHQTFPAQDKKLEFPGDVKHHEICIPCLLIAAKAHSPFAKAQ